MHAPADHLVVVEEEYPDMSVSSHGRILPRHRADLPAPGRARRTVRTNARIADTESMPATPLRGELCPDTVRWCPDGAERETRTTSAALARNK
ncbi:hypothetical protein KNE206_16930 [Kitasatospora sp. NE20-6]